MKKNSSFRSASEKRVSLSLKHSVRLCSIKHSNSLWSAYTSHSIYLYIYKEELTTVVREILACMQPNRHETLTVFWNTYRKVSSRGQRAQKRFSQGACGKKQKTENNCAILVLWRKYTNFCAWFAHCYCGSAIIEMPSWECRWLTLLHSSGSSPKARNNNQLLDDFPGDVVVYKSIDTVPDQNAVTDPTKFLNSLELLGMPPHILNLKLELLLWCCKISIHYTSTMAHSA